MQQLSLMVVLRWPYSPDSSGLWHKSLQPVWLITAVLSLLVVCAVNPVFAEPTASDNTTSADTYKTRKATATLSLKFYEKLQQVMTQNEQGDSDAALIALDKLKNRLDYYNGHEKARLWAAYAFVYYSREEFSKTALAYEKALAEQGAPEPLLTDMRFNLAQVYYLLQHYQKSIDLLEDWLASVQSAGSEACVFIGQVYYEVGEFDQAVTFVERAVRTARAEGKSVKEHWYLLLNALYFEQKAYGKSFKVMLALVHDYPKKQYFTQLAALYGELNNEFKQYSTLVAMHDGGLLDKSAELVGYAQFLLLQKRPYRAAQILQQGLADKLVERSERNLQLQANAWMLAREDKQAIPALQQAAEVATTGETYLLLGQSYLNLERWQDAATAISNALDKGQLKRSDRAHLIAGMALFNLKRYERSLAAFEKAKKDERSRKFARQWIDYVRGERQRLDELAALVAG